jgi:hypothetical protein
LTIRSNLAGTRALLLAVFVWLPALSACAGAGSPLATTTTTTTPITSTTTPTSTTTSASTVGCPEDPAFVDRGRVLRLDQPASDTNRLGRIGWQVDQGCERFGIDFETTEGAPATTPPTVVVDFLPSRQVLRVWTDVESTVITDQLVETGLVNRLYVARALDGGMFVDFHLSAPAQARVAISNSPARMSLELHPGTDPLAAPAVVTDRVVVVGPAVGVETGTVLEVTGYARVFEANLLIIATMGTEVVAQANTTAADGTDTWGEFRAPLTVPVGQISLFVGEEDAGNGQMTGATLDLTVR